MLVSSPTLNRYPNHSSSMDDAHGGMEPVPISKEQVMGQLDPMATPLPRSIPSQPRGETKLQEEPDDAPLPINNKKRKAESEEEWDDEEPVDEGTTAKQPPKNNQKKERFYGTKEEKDRLKGQKEKIESFDWSVFAKSEKPRAILAAKHHHLEVLRKQHGRDWKKKSPSSNLTFPSRQEIHQNPLWYNNTKNLACLAVAALPKYLRNEVVMDREAERNKLKWEEGFICRFCSKKLIEGEASQVRCIDCHWMSLEKVWFALHPGSRWSGFTGNSAIYLIDHAISKGWGVYKVSSLIEGDHATDDKDETSLYNRKTSEFRSLRRQSHQHTLAGCTRRFQEILNGLLEMRPKMDHACKTYDNDSFRRSKASRSLHKKRDAATKKYVKTLDVSELFQFTAPLRHSTQGGYNWKFVEFLHWVRPYWEAKVEDLTPKEMVQFTSDYTKGTTFAA